MVAALKSTRRFPHFFSPPSVFAALAAAFAACGPPVRDIPPVVDLRVCVEKEADVEAYRPHFKSAVAADPRGGRECDVSISASRMHAGKVTVRSAYDGEALAEIHGPVDLAPQLVKIALEPGTDAHRRVSEQRAAARAAP